MRMTAATVTMMMAVATVAILGCDDSNGSDNKGNDSDDGGNGDDGGDGNGSNSDGNDRGLRQ